MKTLLQILDNKSCNSFLGITDAEWYNLGKDYLLPILLAIIASVMVYFIFVKETKRDRKNEKFKKEQEQSDKLLFFSALIGSALKTSIQQKNNIKQYIKLIRKNDIDFHLMTFVPLNDLKRISEVLNLENYLLAYVNKYPLNRKKSIKEFEQIIASIDYLLAVFSQITDQLQRAQSNDHDRKIKFQKIFENSYNLIGKIILDLEHTNPEFYTRLIEILQNFENHHPGNNYDINFYFNYFFVPLNEFSTTYIASGQPLLSHILDLGIYTRDGKQMFGHIKAENIDLKQQLIGDFKLICKTLIELREDTIQLRSEIK